MGSSKPSRTSSNKYGIISSDPVRILGRMLAIVCEMVVAMARLEKKPAKTEILVEAFELENVSPLPLPLVKFPHFPTVSPIVGLYEILVPGMPVGVSFPR